MEFGEKRKVCCFSLDRERELYELAGQINFSAFVKRHLAAELHRRMEMEQRAQLTVHLGVEEAL